MSLITVYVSVSRTMRALAIKARNYLISKLEKELVVVESGLALAEEKRSERMVAIHQQHYKELEDITAFKEREWVRICNEAEDKIKASLDKFELNRCSTAVVHQAIADDLKSRRALLSSELDKLVG